MVLERLPLFKTSLTQEFFIENGLELKAFPTSQSRNSSRLRPHESMHPCSQAELSLLPLQNQAPEVDSPTELLHQFAARFPLRPKQETIALLISLKLPSKYISHRRSNWALHVKVDIWKY